MELSDVLASHENCLKEMQSEYNGTEMEGMDAFQRQLKRFNIRPRYDCDSVLSLSKLKEE